MTPGTCHVCGAALETRFERVIDPQSRETFSIEACTGCGLGHTVPRPAELDRYYGARYYGGRHGFTATYCNRRRLRLAESTVVDQSRKRMLDVGCGDGAFLLAAQQNGWSVTGTEINPSLARSAGLDVFETIDEAATRGPFDCITLWHSLEHMLDPTQTVQSLARLLEPQGAMIVAVPDAEGWQAALFGSAWFHLDVPRHLFHFGGRSLARLLEGAGLAPGRLLHQEFEYDLLGWSQSALNRLMPVPNVFFDTLTGKSSRAGRAECALNFAFGAALSAVAVPATLAGTLAGRGGTLIAIAAKNIARSAGAAPTSAEPAAGSTPSS